MIRILIVHKPGLTRDLLVKALSHESEVQSTAPVDTAQAALVAMTQQVYDVLLVDYHLPDAQVTTLLREASKEFQSVRVVVIGLPDDSDAIVACLELGAAGYVCQADTMQDLVQKVHGAVRGEAMLSPAVAGLLITRLGTLARLVAESNGYATGDVVTQRVALSPRERELVRLLSLGYRNQEIADALQIAVKTVERHVHNILAKLDVHSREQAVMVVHQLALAEARADVGFISQPDRTMPVAMSSGKVSWS